jgi:hypothetical protein
MTVARFAEGRPADQRPVTRAALRRAAASCAQTPAHRGTGTGLWGCDAEPASLLSRPPGGKRHGAQRSVSSPWKRSFCSSGQDKDGTGVHVKNCVRFNAGVNSARNE